MRCLSWDAMNNAFPPTSATRRCHGIELAACSYRVFPRKSVGVPEVEARGQRREGFGGGREGGREGPRGLEHINEGGFITANFFHTPSLRRVVIGVTSKHDKACARQMYTPYSVRQSVVLHKQPSGAQQRYRSGPSICRRPATFGTQIIFMSTTDYTLTPTTPHQSTIKDEGSHRSRSRCKQHNIRSFSFHTRGAWGFITKGP